MNAYILKIVGVIFASIVADIILPDGKIEKYVKSAMAIIIVFVIASPLPELVQSTKNKSYETRTDLIDYNFILNTNAKQKSNLEKQITQSLKDKGIEKVEISFVCDQSTTRIKYLFANVNLENAVLTGQAKSINLKEDITKTILANINIEKENILFYE